MIWAEIKKAINGTLGTPSVKTLDEIIKDAAHDAVYETARLNAPLNVEVVPRMEIIGADQYNEDPIEKVVIPRTVKTISQRSFRGTSIKEVVLPSSVETIEDSAFAFNTALETVIFEGKANTISRNAFASTPALLDVFVPWREDEVEGAPWGAITATIHYNWR